MDIITFNVSCLTLFVVFSYHLHIIRRAIDALQLARCRFLIHGTASASLDLVSLGPLLCWFPVHDCRRRLSSVSLPLVP